MGTQFRQKNERHAAWERFAKMKNESHAGLPKKIPPKLLKPFVLKYF